MLFADPSVEEIGLTSFNVIPAFHAAERRMEVIVVETAFLEHSSLMSSQGLTSCLADPITTTWKRSMICKINPN